MYELIAYSEFGRLTQRFYTKEEAVEKAMILENGGWATEIVEVK